MTKDRRLGRGLAALLGNPSSTESTGEAPAVPPGTSESPAESPAATAAGTPAASIPGHADSGVLRIPVDQIDPNPHQPRRQFDADELKTLAESLQSHQLLQPILVRRVGDRYQLVSGERRWRAAQLAGWDTIPATVREADDRTAAEWSLIENLQRRDLSAIEKARSFQRYLREYQATQEQLARQLQLDRSTIANLLRLLELPVSVQREIESGRLGAGHARALLPLGEESVQEAYCRRVIDEGWSVRETERQVAQRLTSDEANPLADLERRAGKLGKGAKSRQTQALERELKMALGVKVEIQQKGKQAGKIVIHFSSHEEFERIHRILAEGRVAREAA